MSLGSGVDGIARAGNLGDITRIEVRRVSQTIQALDESMAVSFVAIKDRHTRTEFTKKLSSRRSNPHCAACYYRYFSGKANCHDDPPDDRRRAASPCGL